MRLPKRRSGLSVIDVIVEALSGVLERPVRSAMTAVGTVLGVGTVVAVLGLTATAGNQISRAFTLAAATEIRVAESATDDSAEGAFPADSAQRVRRIAGVENVGITWEVDRVSTIGGSPLLDDPTVGVDVTVVAASAGYLAAVGAQLTEGTLPADVHDEAALPVAVIGRQAAISLGISTVAHRPVIHIDQDALQVIGIMDAADKRAELASAVIVSTGWARQHRSGLPPAAEMLVVAQPGAARAVAAQIPVALRPDNPALIVVTPPPDPRELRESVETNIDDLLLLLAGVSLVIGAFGIANTSMMSVLERTSEIGLRRALGAQRRDVAAQFMVESMLIGGVGGILGSSLGVIVALAVAIAQQWTAVVEPTIILAGPLLGMVVGALAGVLPARRASQIEPVRALRS